MHVLVGNFWKNYLDTCFGCIVQHSNNMTSTSDTKMFMKLLGINVEWYSQCTYCIPVPVSAAWAVCCSTQYVCCISHKCINLTYMSFHLHLNVTKRGYCCLGYSCSLIHMLRYCLCTVITGRCSCFSVNQ